MRNLQVVGFVVYKKYVEKELDANDCSKSVIIPFGVCKYIHEGRYERFQLRSIIVNCTLNYNDNGRFQAAAVLYSSMKELDLQRFLLEHKSL